MIRNKSKFLWCCVTAGLVLSGCSGDPGGRGGGFSMPPTPVEVAQVKAQRVVDRFAAVGTIEAEEAVTIVSEIDATLISLPFREGAAMRKGELIARLDDTQLEAEVQRNQALVAQSQATYNRIKEITDQNAGSPQDLDDAMAALQVAKANLALAKARFAKTRILAPFDGMVGARRVSPGAFLRAGQAITDLAQIEELRVKFSAPERYIARLLRGAKVTVSTTAFPGYELQGEIIVVEPILDETTRSASVIARLENSGKKFRPGMSADITMALSERPEALTIPSEAIFATGDQSFAYVIKPDSSVARVALKLGTRMANFVEVVQGLEKGMQVVRAGHQKLFDGAKVMPVMSQDGAAASSNGADRN